MRSARSQYHCGVSLCVLAVLVVAAPAAADWIPGDGHKMHYPQLPDPNGFDVAFLDGNSNPAVLADDWRCSESGWVEDLHFWCSWREDIVGQIASIEARIYSNDPDGPEGYYSAPDQLLWQQTFLAGQFQVAGPWSGNQGWIHPGYGYYYDDHTQYFQVNIEGIVDPFQQTRDEIYWLGLYITSTGGEIGWKTTQDSWMDTVVYWNSGGSGQWSTFSQDMAFVITGTAVPEPATMGLLACGSAGLLLRKRRISRA